MCYYLNVNFQGQRVKLIFTVLINSTETSGTQVESILIKLFISMCRTLEGHYQDDFPVNVFGGSCDKIIAYITSTYFLGNTRDLVPIRVSTY